MSTLMITTPGMGKTYLVKEMKRHGVLAIDFDIKGAKPTNDETWDAVRTANTSYINAMFDAGYKYITAWPDSVDVYSLNKDVDIIFVIPVGDAWTGCMLRIAARQPGTAFIDEISDNYHHLVDSIEGMYLDAMNTHQNVTKVIVTKAHDTLCDVWSSLRTTGYDGGIFLDANPSLSPESAIEAVLPQHSKFAAYEIFKNCLTPDLANFITFAIDTQALNTVQASAHGFGMFSYCRLTELAQYCPNDSQVTRISNTCGLYHLISLKTLIESDEMGDWYRESYIFFKTVD